VYVCVCGEGGDWELCLYDTSLHVKLLDYHSHNTHSKDTIRSIKSTSNRGLLRSVNCAGKKASFFSFRMSLLDRIKF